MDSPPPFNPNPYGVFDPSQWKNPYSQFQNGPFPYPPTYSGWPTDAMGNPIRPPPGGLPMAAPAPQAPAPSLNPSQWNYNNDMLNAMGLGLMQGGHSAMSLGDIVHMRLQNDKMYGLTQAGPVLQSTGPHAVTPSPQPAPAPAAAPQGGTGLTWDQAISLLANPGHVTTPGATVPQAQPGYQPTSTSPSVLQNFLANWKPPAAGGSPLANSFINNLRSMYG